MRARAWPLPLALVSLAFAASLLLAGALPLIHPDEGRNAAVARELSVGGDLVIPHLAGTPSLATPARGDVRGGDAGRAAQRAGHAGLGAGGLARRGPAAAKA